MAPLEQIPGLYEPLIALDDVIRALVDGSIVFVAPIGYAQIQAGHPALTGALDERSTSFASQVVYQHVDDRC